MDIQLVVSRHFADIKLPYVLFKSNHSWGDIGVVPSLIELIVQSADYDTLS